MNYPEHVDALKKIFEEDIKNFIKELFNDFIIKENLKLTKQSIKFLQNASYDNLLRCFAYNKQKIPSGKKRVLLSKELLSSPLYRAFKKRIDEIKKCFEIGQNISQYLTNHQNHLIFQDYLLNDWGIIHLHINPIGKRHPATDGILLFVLVRENKAFFINIGNHNSFLDIELLRIIEKNWHNILDCYTINGTTPENLSSKEMLDLRKNNIIYTINVNNKCYTTQLNHSLKIPFSLVALKKILDDIALLVSNNISDLTNVVKSHTGKDSIDIHLYFDKNSQQILLCDSCSGIRFNINNIDHFKILSQMFKELLIF